MAVWVDWSNLHEDILHFIAQRLFHITDYVSFGAVCRTWRSVALRNHVSLPKGIPVLMIPSNDKEEEEEEEEEEETRRFYSITDKRVYDFQVPVPPYHYCCGSTKYGWLITVDNNETFVMRLLNPFSRRNNEIQLPPLATLPKGNEDGFNWDSCNFYKAVLSSNPSSTLDFLVLAIFDSRDLAFCRPSDKEWTPIKREGLHGYVSDAIFYNQNFYLVDSFGKVMACDVNQPCPSLTTVALPPTDVGIWRKRFLVESLGDLLQIEKISKWCKLLVSGKRSNKTVWCNVYKRDWSEGKWIEVKNLGDRMLFLGDNTSFSVSASDFPTGKPNCIYFTDDYYCVNGEDPDIGAHDFGMFSLEDGSIEPLYPSDSQPVVPSPIWVLPAL